MFSNCSSLCIGNTFRGALVALLLLTTKTFLELDSSNKLQHACNQDIHRNRGLYISSSFRLGGYANEYSSISKSIALALKLRFGEVESNTLRLHVVDLNEDLLSYKVLVDLDISISTTADIQGSITCLVFGGKHENGMFDRQTAM